MPRTLAALLIACAFIFTARAQEKPDPSTPKGAVLAFFKAMEKGDVAEAKTMATGNQKQLAILDTLVPFMSGFKQLEGAAVKKWGEEGKKILADGQGGGGTAFNIDEELKNAKVEEKGDAATIMPAEQKSTGPAKPKKDPMNLKKIDGKWKVDLASIPAEGFDDPNTTRVLKSMGDIAKSTAAEIDTGKYATADDAKKAMSEKMLPLLLGGLGQPTPPPANPDPQKNDKK